MKQWHHFLRASVIAISMTVTALVCGHATAQGLAAGAHEDLIGFSSKTRVPLPDTLGREPRDSDLVMGLRKSTMSANGTKRTCRY